MAKRPALFIACSRENMAIARAIQRQLDYDADSWIWDQGTFGPSQYPLEALEQALDRADFGLFVFAPDDKASIRGQDVNTVRDNVIFELGMFVGRLSRQRVFIVKPRATDLHLPTDLAGLNPVTYESNRQDENLDAALGAACSEVRDAMLKIRALPRSTPLESVLPLLDEADENIPDEYFVPAADWDILRYEQAYAISLMSDRDDSAKSIAEAFRESHTQDPELLAGWEAWQEIAAMRTGRSASVSKLKSLAHAHPANARVKELLGQALLRYDDVTGAAEAYAEAASLSKNLVLASRAVINAIALSKFSNQPADLDALTAIVAKLHVSDPQADLAYANAMREIAKAKELSSLAFAIDEVRIDIAPDDMSVRFNLAHGYAELNQPELAMFHYRSVPESERSGQLWNNLGVAYSALHMKGWAVAAYKKGSSEGETFADGNLAFNFLGAGFLDEAQQQAEKSLVEHGHSENVVKALAAVDDARKSEQSLADQAILDARGQRDFLIQVGCAALDPEEPEFTGTWTTPECEIVLSRQESGEYIGVGQFTREVNGIALALMGASRGHIKDEIVEVIYRLRRFGNAFEGNVHRNAKGGPPPSLVGGLFAEQKVLGYMDVDQDALFVKNERSSDGTVQRWTSRASAALSEGTRP